MRSLILILPLVEYLYVEQCGAFCIEMRVEMKCNRVSLKNFYYESARIVIEMCSQIVPPEAPLVLIRIDAGL